MFKAQQKETGTSEEKTQTVVGESVTLEGNFKSQDDILVYGKIIGGVTTSKDLKCAPTSGIKGDLSGENVFVSGVVEGNIKAKNKLEISSSGKIFGDIEAGTLSIAEGANFCGQCKMGEQSTKSKTPNSK